MINIKETNLEGVYIINSELFSDQRGFFLETYQKNKFFDLGIDYEFVQDNHSRSKKNVLRGLHYQIEKPQGKLVRCTKGKVFDVVVDIKKNSKTFGEYFSIVLDDVSLTQLWIPPGYAHGFCVLSDCADFQYKCTQFYFPELERGIIWNDKDIQIDWPIHNPLISEKDLQFTGISEI